jgi:ligand-binding sensor domain-containing protein/signal transduction histidine kinase
MTTRFTSTVGAMLFPALGFVLVIASLIPPCNAASRTVAGSDLPFLIDAWDTDDGLPPNSQNSVTAIVQTRDGFLWFGTLNGLVRFDGRHFTLLNEDNTPGLNSSRIVCLFEDRSDRLWIGTGTAGVAFLENGRATSVGIGQGTSEKRLLAACQDRSGAVWLHTANGEIWRYFEDRFGVFVLGQEGPSTLRTLAAETSGTIWAGNDTRLVAVGSDPVAGSLEPQVIKEIAIAHLDGIAPSTGGGLWRLADQRIQKWRGDHLERDLGSYPWGRVPLSAACEDRQGNLVVATLGAGVFWFDSTGSYLRLTTSQGLAHDIVLSITVDRDGNLWVGTDGRGLNRVKRQRFEVLDRRRAPSAVVQSVAADPVAGVWAASNGGGIAHVQADAATFFGSSEGLATPHLSAVLVDRTGMVWAGSYRAGLFMLDHGRFERATGLDPMPADVFALHQDRQGRLWVGTQTGLWRRDDAGWRSFTTREGLSADEVRAIADSPDGAVWIGTVGGGLSRFENGRFSAFHKTDEGLPSEDISSLLVDPDGGLWIGTFGSGLACFRQGRWVRYTTREGLLSNSIGYLLDDGSGNLWIGSNAGLMRIARTDLERFAPEPGARLNVSAYGREAGLPTRECTAGSQPGAARSRDGRLWFPTVMGLASVHPDRFLSNTNPPPVRIEAVYIDGLLVATNTLVSGPPRAITVPAGREHLEIHYASLDLVASDRDRFKFRMHRHESLWTEAGDGTVARYSRLPAGQYRFEVNAANADGVWNLVPTVLEVTVLTPIWRTGWFLVTAALVGLGTLVGLIHYASTQRLQRQLERLRQEEALERERARIARDIHDQLGASLTHLALLGELADSDRDAPDAVAEHAHQISQTARDTTRVLDEIVWAVNPANDTLDGLMTYVSKHAAEYLAVAGVRCRIEAPAQLPSHNLPPEVRHEVFLAFKESITNVLRHAAATAVWIRLELRPDAFCLEVEDNGRGVPPDVLSAPTTRNGLRNMRRRLEDIGGSFELGPAAEGGTRARFTVPLGRPARSG